LGEVGQRPVLDFAALAIGLTDQDGAVLAAALAAGYDGYVHGTGRTLRHIQIVAYWAPGVNASNGYIGTQAQTRIAFKSFRNFRLADAYAQLGQLPSTGRVSAPACPQRADHLEAAVYVQLLEEKMHVVLHGLGLEEQLPGDLLVAQPFGHQLHD